MSDFKWERYNLGDGWTQAWVVWCVAFGIDLTVRVGAIAFHKASPCEPAEASPPNPKAGTYKGRSLRTAVSWASFQTDA